MRGLTTLTTRLRKVVDIGGGPNDQKKEYVVPIFKKGHKNNLVSCRPFHLT